MAIDNVPIDDITDMLNDIEGMMNSSTVSEEELQPTKEVGAPLTDDDTDLSDADQPLDIQMLLSNTTYIGEVPYSTIVEYITSQFENYIGTTDRSDYVDIFYDQLDESYSVINDEDEYHDEKRYFLDNLEEQFISFMSTEFENRLGITLAIVEEEEYDQNEIEFIIRETYEYFILKAPFNFTTAIVKDMTPHLTISDDNDTLLNEIQSKLMAYSPIITTMTPTEFLNLTDGVEIQAFYEDNMIVGNFLKKYVLKLYQYPEFEVQLINTISLALDQPTETTGGM